MLMVVVLPAPFGPSRAKTSPGATVKSRPSRTRWRAEGLAEAADLDGWLHDGSSLCTYETVYDHNTLFT